MLTLEKWGFLCLVFQTDRFNIPSIVIIFWQSVKSSTKVPANHLQRLNGHVNHPAVHLEEMIPSFSKSLFRMLDAENLVLASSPIVLCVCVLFGSVLRTQVTILDGVQHQMRDVDAVVSGCSTTTPCR